MEELKKKAIDEAVISARKSLSGGGFVTPSDEAIAWMADKIKDLQEQITAGLDREEGMEVAIGQLQDQLKEMQDKKYASFAGTSVGHQEGATMAAGADKEGNFKDDMQKLEILAELKPITPLTGDEVEWQRCGESMFQNKRLSSVFKDADDRPYDIDGRVYWEWYKNEDGEVCKTHFTKGGDRFYIEFPYTAKPPVEVFSPTDDYPNEKLQLIKTLGLERNKRGLM